MEHNAITNIKTKPYRNTMVTLSTLCITLLMSSFLLCRVSARADRDNIVKTGGSENFMRSQTVAVSQSRISDSANNLMSLQFSLGAITSSFLSVFEGSAPNSHNCHVKKLGFQLALLVVQKSGVLLFPEFWMKSTSHPAVIVTVPPANSVETLPKCEITKVLVLPTSVVALIMDSTTRAVRYKFSVPSQPKHQHIFNQKRQEIHLNSFSTWIREFSESSKMRSSDPHPLLVLTWPSLACGGTDEFDAQIWSRQTLICFPLGHWKKQSSSIVLSTNSSNLCK